MTGLRGGHEDDEDLVVAARRRPLVDAERRDLGAALDADPTLRIAHEVGRAFDGVTFVRPGDEALIARAVDRTLGIGNRRVATRRWRIGAAVAAGFLLAGGVAGAYRAGIVQRARRAPAVDNHDVSLPAPRARSTTHPARAGVAPKAPPSTPVPPVAAAQDPEGDPFPPRPPRTSRTSIESAPSVARPAARAALPSPEPDEQPPAPMPPTMAPVSRSTTSATTAGASDGNVVTAADLFQRAGAARRAGYLAMACGLYDDLQARFPAAEEARLSHVSLGKLLLAMGRPQEAERHFALYLAGGAGALAAEAAFGRAQSFEQMGRAREERQAWLGLLRDFPGSVYAGAARRRSAALGGSDVGAPGMTGDVPPGVETDPR